MATWLALAILAVTITSLVAASLVSLATGDTVTDGQRRATQFTGRSEERPGSGLRRIDRAGTVGLATGQEFVAATDRLINPYLELKSTPTDALALSEELIQAYRDDFVPTLEVAPDHPAEQ